MADLQFPEWQREYQAALFELDRTKLPERVRAAESALLKRLHAISQNLNSNIERQKIHEALSNLSVIKKRNGGSDSSPL
jgi:hypothetical protein